MSKPVTVLERLAIGLASLLLSVGLIALLSGFFTGRDQAGVGKPATVMVQRFPDQGHAHLAPGEGHPRYNSAPPTSGAHVPQPVLQQARPLTDDQLLEALELGDVVIAYGSASPPPALLRLVDEVSGRFSPPLAAVGQAVILMRRPGTRGAIGLAWTRMLRATAPADPHLLQFTEQWLGHGAPGA